MDINKIIPYSKNAKKHPSKQIKQIANSIKEFGFNQPIVIDKNNVVIVGHGRLEAAKLLKMDDVPVLQVDLDKKKAAAYRLADNKLNESDWEMDLVIEELKELESEELVELIGFDDFSVEILKPEVILDDIHNEGSGIRSITVYLPDEQMEDLESVLNSHEGRTVSEKVYNIAKIVGHGDK